MHATTLRSAPSLADYTPLAEYETQTPASFVDGKPILHLHLEGAKASVPSSQTDKLPLFEDEKPATEAGDGEAADVERVVDVFVNSESLTIFSAAAGSGVSIPYQSISIHAVKQVTPAGQSEPQKVVWMMLEFTQSGDDDDSFEPIELTIAPADPSKSQEFYDALATCSNLHPDEADEEDEDDYDPFDRIVIEGSAEHQALEGFSGVWRGTSDGGLPPPLPGSGGWITAENVHEYFDEEGNWIEHDGQGEEEVEELGEGAGSRHARDETKTADVNGHADEDASESKRQRTE